MKNEEYKTISDAIIFLCELLPIAYQISNPNKSSLKIKEMKKVFFILSMAFAAVTVLSSCSDKKVTKETFIGKWELKSFQHQYVNSDEWVE